MNMRVQMMSDTKTRKVHSAGFKAKVALEAVRETKTLNEIGQEYGVHPVQVKWTPWSRQNWGGFKL
jgi:transposase-like protein